MNGRDKRRLQRCLEDLYCNQCDICVCGCSSNAAVDKCDCCIKPMEKFLIRLKSILTDANGTITLYLTNGKIVKFAKTAITTIQDGIITGTGFVSGKVISVSICEISRVETYDSPALTADQITLLDPPSCTCGECDCCERPMREKLATYTVDTELFLFYVGIVGTPAKEKFKKVGLGIALTEDSNGQLIGYSTCKITHVAED